MTSWVGPARYALAFYKLIPEDEKAALKPIMKQLKALLRE